MRILVAYWVTPNSLKAASWNDGFVRAMELLEQEFEVLWFNCAEHSPKELRALTGRAQIDFVLAKTNWRWIVDKFVRKALQFKHVKRGIMISGIAKPPPRFRMRFYNVLFYQTEWYGQRLRGKHPKLVHAYGINTSMMRPPSQAIVKKWDWLFVGNIVPSKRPLRLLSKSGRILAVGDLSRSDPSLVAKLRAHGVTVMDYVSYAELRELYWKSKTVLVCATEFGGGERAVIEAVACGTPVVIPPDNPKLREVLQSASIWSEYYYYEQLRKGILSCFETDR